MTTSARGRADTAPDRPGKRPHPDPERACHPARADERGARRAFQRDDAPDERRKPRRDGAQDSRQGSGGRDTFGRGKQARPGSSRDDAHPRKDRRGGQDERRKPHREGSQDARQDGGPRRGGRNSAPRPDSRRDTPFRREAWRDEDQTRRPRPDRDSTPRPDAYSDQTPDAFAADDAALRADVASAFRRAVLPQDAARPDTARAVPPERFETPAATPAADDTPASFPLSAGNNPDAAFTAAADTPGDPAAPDAPLLCGVKPVRELLERDPGRVDLVFVRRGAHGDTDAVLDLCRAAKVRFQLCDPREMDQLPARFGAGSALRHQGVLARLAAASYVELDTLLEQGRAAPLPLIVMADQVQDPGNLGTLARTLYALGGAGLIVPKHNSAYLGAGARRAAAGALEQLPVCRASNLAQALDTARAAGYHLYGAACAETSRNVYDTPLELPAVLVLGGEESGIRRLVAGRCETLLHIPMLRAFDSLNVAQAGAILIGECLRRQTRP